jgi:hypothetical protein
MLYNHWWCAIVIMCQRKDVAHERMVYMIQCQWGSKQRLQSSLPRHHPHLYSVAHDIDTLGYSLFLPLWHIIEVTQDECSQAGQISHTRSVTCLAQEEKYQAPPCKTCVFQYDRTCQLSSVWVKYEIMLIHHSPCPSSIGNCEKGLIFCLSCGSQSSHTFGRLQDRWCKCVGDKKKAKRALINRS